jgi:hypothetical protein
MANLTLLEFPINRVHQSGTIHVKLMLIEADDEGIGYATGTNFNHRMSFEPGCDIDDVIAMVNAHLERGVVASDGRARVFPPISAKAVQVIKECAAANWSQELLAAWAKFRADQETAAAAERRAHDDAAKAAQERNEQEFAARVAAEVERALAEKVSRAGK